MAADAAALKGAAESGYPRSMLTRRAFSVALAGLAAAGAARAAGEAEANDTLRFVRVRHRTLLLEIGGRRILVDPCFEPGLGAPGLFTAPPPAFSAEATGSLDLLLVTGGEPGAFSAASTRALRGRDVRCLVPEERIARVLRFQGYRRVRVVVPGDRFVVAGVEVRVSPSSSLGMGPGVGYWLSRAGRTFWCAGAPPPVDVDGRAPSFARDHEAEVVAACALGLSVGGRPLTLDADDALLLAGLARARWVAMLQHDAAPVGLGALLFGQTRPVRHPAAAGPRVVVAPAGTWCRVRAFG